MSILSRSAAREAIALWRNKNKTVVFTNGCFDILHRGHIDYLTRAKELGDVLVVGLNSDASVRRIKGKPRPLQNETSRSVVLDALAVVDAVVIFEEDTPRNLINELLPDVLVKGGDYEVHSIVGAQEVIARGGEVKILPYLKGYGTSEIVGRILSSKNL